MKSNSELKPETDKSESETETPEEHASRDISAVRKSKACSHMDDIRNSLALNRAS